MDDPIIAMQINYKANDHPDTVLQSSIDRDNWKRLNQNQQKKACGTTIHQ